jgi:hypothetical protein
MAVLSLLISSCCVSICNLNAEIVSLQGDGEDSCWEGLEGGICSSLLLVNSCITDAVFCLAGGLVVLEGRGDDTVDDIDVDSILVRFAGDCDGAVILVCNVVE